MTLFLTEHIRTDITAVKFFQSHILAGIGDHLYIFDKENYQYLRKFKIFDGLKIYGIVPHHSNGKILLFSGEHLQIVEISETFQNISKLAYTIYPDWILDAQWDNNGETIITVSMHNKLQIWDLKFQIKMERECEDSCILYSANIYNDKNSLIIFAGTVFSEVLIWNGGRTIHGKCSILKRLLGHKGVIFSVHYNASVGQLCSTSDDRSAILWCLDKESFATLNPAQEINYVQVYGHTARIFRSMVLRSTFVTAGEDSVLNVWSHKGKLVRKIEMFQGSSIWSLDCDEENNQLVTGSGEGGVGVIKIHISNSEQKYTLPNFEKPKHLVILNNNDLLVVSEKGTVFQLKQSENNWQMINKFEELKNYILLKISNCRKLIALAGIHGQIYIYKEEEGVLRLIIQYQTKLKSRIFSFHWLTCNSFLACQNGLLLLFVFKANSLKCISKFVLPYSKERWTTCGILVDRNIIVGDRKGHIHLFEIQNPNALQTFKKAHSFLGVTNIIRNNERIISLGREGLVKTFTLKENNLLSATVDKLPLNWLVDVVHNLVLAFSSDNFLIWDQTAKRILIKKLCGGGHRSWDFHFKDNFGLFSYIKDKTINVTTLDFRELISKDLFKGFHVGEVNCLEVLKINQMYVVISGGEDTTLRITSIKENTLENKLIIKSHLSSIRSITSWEWDGKNKGVQEFLFFSAGGRAQIICWKLSVFETNNSCSFVCNEEYSYYEPVSNEESEIRIMDLLIIRIDGVLTLFSACSDGNINTYKVGIKNERFYFEFLKTISYKQKCIIKLGTFTMFGKNVLVSMATDGCLTFWDTINLYTDANIQQFGSIKIHQSGINSYTSKLIDSDVYLFLTGGDDNMIALTLVKFEMNKNCDLIFKIISMYTDVGTHCAQITGLYLGTQHFISISIDQRLALFSWKLEEGKLNCRFINKYNTVISDIKGLTTFETSSGWDIFLYGNGMEFLKMKT